MKPNYVSVVLRSTIAIIFLQTLYYKFTAHPDSVYIFSALGAEPYGRIGLGIVELITAILLLLPRTKLPGIVMSLGIISGAIFSHLLVLGVHVKGDGGTLFILALVVFIASLVLVAIYKNAFRALIDKAKKRKTSSLLVMLNLLFFQGCAQNKDQEKMILQPTEKMNLTEKEWKNKLSEEQYYILREKGTESPFSGEFVFTKEKGIYKCAGCGEALFTDAMKFESHCGWPSFDTEITGGKIIQTQDNSHGMQRTEITCAKCGGHLGHLFDDGPTATGNRYCVNSGALSFEAAQPPTNIDPLDTTETITLGGGCFWCMEAIFEELKGVQKVESGYSGGETENPSYKQVCSGTTKHAEVVQIHYNPHLITTEEILEVFFSLHDPTTLNRQGADVGTQYRSAIFYHNSQQQAIANTVIKTLNQGKAFNDPIVTEVSQFKAFYKAENYHQEYYELNKEEPYCKMVIAPKVTKLHKIFSEKLKK